MRFVLIFSLFLFSCSTVSDIEIQDSEVKVGCSEIPDIRFNFQTERWWCSDNPNVIFWFDDKLSFSVHENEIQVTTSKLKFCCEVSSEDIITSIRAENCENGNTVFRITECNDFENGFAQTLTMENREWGNTCLDSDFVLRGLKLDESSKWEIFK